MTELLFDRDPITKSIQTFHFDESRDEFTLEDQQDVTAIIEHNKALQSAPLARNEGHRVASIPLNIYFDLRKQWREQGLSYDERRKAMARWLNDPDNRVWRTTTERI